MIKRTIEIYTDGSASPNPGPGACGFIVVHQEKIICEMIFKSRIDTTNNRMELSAVIFAMQWAQEQLKRGEKQLLYLYTDSQYVERGINKWLDGWTVKAWRGSNGTINNVDLWMKVDNARKGLNLQVIWVRGHAGNKWNEKIDKLIREKGYGGSK